MYEICGPGTSNPLGRPSGGCVRSLSLDAGCWIAIADDRHIAVDFSRWIAGRRTIADNDDRLAVTCESRPDVLGHAAAGSLSPAASPAGSDVNPREEHRPGGCAMPAGESRAPSP